MTLSGRVCCSPPGQLQPTSSLPTCPYRLVSLRWQQPRSSCVPTMRRNRQYGSAPSRHNLLQRKLSPKNLESGHSCQPAKQVLWDILDTVDACDDSEQPFDDLKKVLLRQFGKANSNLILPSILMGKLKQLLPHGVSPDMIFSCPCFQSDKCPPCERQ